MIARNIAGVAQVTAPHTAVTGGYLTSDYQESGSAFRRTYVEADGVDASYEVSREASNRTLTWVIYIEGADFAEVRARHTALLTATQSGQWLLDVLGDNTTVVWACDAADEQAPVFYPDGSRLVTLSISAKPLRGY